MLEVIKPGLETSVQDYPGRIGFWNQGFPPSGPMDSWSFRLANVVVGNEPGAAALECQFVGPTLKFQRGGVIAVTGADMQPKLDDQPIPMWESFAVEAGQTLALSFAKIGARAYIAIAGLLRHDNNVERAINWIVLNPELAAQEGEDMKRKCVQCIKRHREKSKIS